MKSQSTPSFAFFDLDHTLIPMDSDFSWGTYTVKLGWVDPDQFASRNEQFYSQYKNGTLDIHEYIEFATRALRMRSREECLNARSAYVSDVIAPVIMPAALSLVKKHQELGDTIVLVTATNEFVTRPIAPLFGIEHLIAVDLEIDAITGGYTGGISGVPSFREGKVARVKQWLRSRGLDLAITRTTFYSDSINDLPLLEAVDKPVATNPDDALRRIAQERNWEIVELFR